MNQDSSIPHVIADDKCSPRRRLVILDKNFLQSENSSTPRLSKLVRDGYDLVLIDTLVYELCSDNRISGLWDITQKKLFRFADYLHFWSHSSELIRQEARDGRAVSGPRNQKVTDALRNHCKSCTVYKPDDYENIIEGARQEREVGHLERIQEMARTWGRLFASGESSQTNDELAQAVVDVMENEECMRVVVNEIYGKDESADTYIVDASDRVDLGWLSFHGARVTLVLIAMFLRKYGLRESPGKKFINTKLDLEYLLLLHYADALASDETSGDMDVMLRWLYGSSKGVVTSGSLLGETHG